MLTSANLIWCVYIYYIYTDIKYMYVFMYVYMNIVYVAILKNLTWNTECDAANMTSYHLNTSSWVKYENAFPLKAPLFGRRFLRNFPMVKRF